MTEKDLALQFTKGLKKLGIDCVIHIPNKSSRGYANRGLKYFPDYMLAHGGYCYMVELGIAGKNKARKEKQWLLMQKWANAGDVKICILHTLDDICEFFRMLNHG